MSRGPISTLLSLAIGAEVYRTIAALAVVLAACGGSTPQEMPTPSPDALILDGSDLGEGWLLSSQDVDAPAGEAVPNCEAGVSPLEDNPTRVISTEYQNPDLDVSVLQLIAEFESTERAVDFVELWRRLTRACPIDAEAEGFSIERDAWTPSVSGAVGVYLAITAPSTDDTGDDFFVSQWVAVVRFGEVVAVLNTASQTEPGNAWANLAAELTAAKAEA